MMYLFSGILLTGGFVRALISLMSVGLIVFKAATASSKAGMATAKSACTIVRMYVRVSTEINE